MIYNLYEIIKNNEPNIFIKLKFFRAIKLIEKTSWGKAETENSYAIYDDGKKYLGIQLEPMTPVICLNNQLTQIEIGDWNGNDYYGDSIQFIKKVLLKNEKPMQNDT